jgi:NAD(P)H-nitrite reductase large subunit
MSTEHFIVIGNGPAGNQAALTLKECLPDALVTIISKDPHSSYKPSLLPDFIAGKIPKEAIFKSSLKSYEPQGIKFRYGQDVVRVDLNRRELTLDHREILPFTGLIIAVGGKPRIPEPLLVFEDLLLTLKTPKDATHWIEALSRAERVLIMGGDLTSLALTKAMIHLKKDVHLMLNEDAFWPLRCNQALFDEVARHLSGKGVHILEYSRLKGMARLPEQGFQVGIDDKTIEVDLIGAFFGLIPDIRFLARSGLQIDRGILVDEYLNTGFEGVYATGDCAQIYHPEIHDYWVSIGHNNAVNLGRVAALNIAGGRVRAEKAKESIFDVQGIKVNTSWWAEF